MKRKTHFQFKQFTIQHDRCAMRVGTDAVLLGAWADVQGAKNILDIGTGSGVIALMMAQRTTDESQIHAVEIDPVDSGQAMDNIQHSPWPDKVKVFNVPVQVFFPARRYDLILSNPPYFNNSQKPPAARRMETRHTVKLNFETLINEIRRLISKGGKFNVILPDTEGQQFAAIAEQNQFYCSRRHGFRAREGKPIERWLLEFSDQKLLVDCNEILHYAEGNTWSADYKALTRDFYLKL